MRKAPPVPAVGADVGRFKSPTGPVNRNILIVGAILFVIVTAACALMVAFGIDVITDPVPTVPPGR